MAQQQIRVSIFDISLRVRAVVLVAFAMFTAILTIVPAAQAQALNVLHTFTGGADGGQPFAGLTKDAAGNLYGTTASGGSGGYGTVFKMTHRSSGWEFSTLYRFHGDADGAFPESRVIFGPDGALYGTTNEGGEIRAEAITPAAASSSISGPQQQVARPPSVTGLKTLSTHSPETKTLRFRLETFRSMTEAISTEALA